MTDKDTAKRPSKGRPSTLLKNRRNFSLRINEVILDELRAMADKAQFISLNAYIQAVLAHHATKPNHRIYDPVSKEGATQ